MDGMIDNLMHHLVDQSVKIMHTKNYMFELSTLRKLRYQARCALIYEMEMIMQNNEKL